MSSTLPLCKKASKSVWRPQQSPRRDSWLQESGASAQLHALRSWGGGRGSPAEPQGQSPMAAGDSHQTRPDALTPRRWVGSALSNSSTSRQEGSLCLAPACPTGYSVCGRSGGGHGLGAPGIRPCSCSDLQPGSVPKVPRARECPAPVGPRSLPASHCAVKVRLGCAPREDAG